MQLSKAYNKVIKLIAPSTPQDVIDFRPFEEANDRVADLIFREKTERLPDHEKSELDLCLQIEHLKRLAKARASLSDKWLDGSVRNFARQSLTTQACCASTAKSPRRIPVTAAKSITSSA